MKESAPTNIDYIVRPSGPLRGEIRVPGDKSISHRCIMLGAVADGDTQVMGLLEGEDVLATVAAFRSLGVEIDGPEDGEAVVHGVGREGLRAPAAAIDLGNSGTAMRLLAGLLAGQGFDCTLIGDASLDRRPMRRITEPLARMGARIETADGGHPATRDPCPRRACADRLHDPGGQRPGEVEHPSRGAVRERADLRDGGGADARPHRKDAGRVRRDPHQ